MPKKIRFNYKRAFSRDIRASGTAFVKYSSIKKLSKLFSGNIIRVYKHIKWALVDTRDVDVSTLFEDDNIKAAVPDVEIRPHGLRFPGYVIPETRNKIHKFFGGEGLIEYHTHYGEDVRVAVIDTGIDVQNNELAALIEGTHPGDVMDVMGHGTAVTSTILQITTPKLLVYRLFDKNGKAKMSNLLDAIEWCREKGANIVNISLGARIPMPSTNPISEALDYAYRRGGMLAVVSAGNSGPSLFSVSTPAVTRTAITVGATYYDGRIAEFSSRGASLDFVPKPDLVAWGVHLKLLRADGLTKLVPIDDKHVLVSGTSFSAPQITGLAAIIYGVVRDAGSTKKILYASAKLPRTIYRHEIDATLVEPPEILLDDISVMGADYHDELLRVVSQEGIIRNTYGHGIPNFEDIVSRLS